MHSGRCQPAGVPPIGADGSPVIRARTEEVALARAASSSTAKARRSSSQQAAANAGNFELRSLQEEFAKERRYKADTDLLLHLYEQMLLIRRFEEKAGQLYGLGLIGGFCHLYIGQEAVAVGVGTSGGSAVLVGARVAPAVGEVCRAIAVSVASTTEATEVPCGVKTDSSGGLIA